MKLKQTPSWFDASNLEVTQHRGRKRWHTGPVFSSRAERLAGQTALVALLYGYGGFEISLQPSYWRARARLGLKKAVCSSSRTSEAAANTGRDGTKLR